MRIITFNGTKSSDIPVYVGETGFMNGPEPDYKTVSVPGRNGDLIYLEGDEKRYQNVPIPYRLIAMASTKAEMRNAATAAKAWLEPCFDSYYRLEDTEDPDHFRLAQYTGPFQVENFMLRSGAIDVEFSCKPQRFLTSGETAQSFTADGTITNPTSFEAKPLVRIYCTGTGTVMIGSRTITIASGATAYIDVDSEIMDCYEGTEIRNSLVTLTDGYPVLSPGDNGITISGDVTQVDITPHWWEL